MTPWVTRLCRPMINRTLRDQQQIVQLEFHGLDHLRSLLELNVGVLITPNHSFHYDSYVLIEAGHRVGRPFHFLTAWQVFAMSGRFDQWMLQRHGCFSINREAVDSRAFKTATDILCASPSPLVVFAEGDIYHCNDRVMPFRDGAAAIGLAAARKKARAVAAVPCALKCYYLEDPSDQLAELMDRLESLIQWRPQRERSLADRIYRFAGAILALKEIEYLGTTQTGRLSDRAAGLANHLVSQIEARYQVHASGDIPERVKEVRRTVIRTSQRADLSAPDRGQLAIDMEDLFLVIQLISYPGNYLSQSPTIERLAETCDKFEEDLLQAVYPAVRGRRRVEIQFGESIPIPAERGSRDAVNLFSKNLECQVQKLLDEMNSRNQQSGRETYAGNK